MADWPKKSSAPHFHADTVHAPVVRRDKRPGAGVSPAKAGANCNEVCPCVLPLIFKQFNNFRVRKVQAIVLEK
jgi:hypothetical protein